MRKPVHIIGGISPIVVDELGDVAGEPGDIGGALGIAAVAGQQIAVVLDHGAAARGGDEDGVERLLANDGGPGVDIAAGVAARLLFLAEMMRQRAAAGLVLDHDDIDAMTPEQPDGGAADGGRSTSCTQPSISATRLALGSLPISDRGLVSLRLEHARRHQRERGGGRSRPARAMSPRNGRASPPEHQREPEAARMGQHLAQDQRKKRWRGVR